jgi:hypothetical protein
MKIRRHFNTLLLLGAATAADAQVQPQLAQQWFEEVTKLCERDAGRLWGISLCGPMVIFDQATRTRATSQPEPEGPAPRFPAGADGPVTWGGSRWFAFPLFLLTSTDTDGRQQNMIHGLYHRIQPQLTFMQGNTDDGFSEHLDTLEGRIWMQLEWRVLRRAVESSGSEQAQAVADALAFRGERRRLFPGAADNEKREEIREGLASYTGIAVWANSPADAHREAATALAGGEMQTSFVGNFEAASGPGYGVLLDDLLPGWRRQLRGSSDLGDLLASATNRPTTTDLAVAAARYDGAALRATEEARDRAQQVRVTELLRRFVDGPVLTMGAIGSGTGDTNDSVGILGAGTVFFHNFTLSAQWGRFTANGGVLRSADGSTLTVPVTEPLEGATPAGGRLERHSEFRVGSAASGTTWLLCYRSRELISVPTLDFFLKPVAGSAARLAPRLPLSGVVQTGPSKGLYSLTGNARSPFRDDSRRPAGGLRFMGRPKVRPSLSAATVN